MDKELEITTPLDRNIDTENQSLLDEIEKDIEEAVRHQDAEEAFAICERMVGNIRRSGIGLAKALWMINKYWDVFQIGDEFEATAQHYLSLHPHTIERYVKVWEMITNVVPAEFKEDLQQKNIKTLIPIANAVAQGYEFENKDWETITNSADYAEVSKAVRDATGKTPRSNNLSLKIDANGSIWAYTPTSVVFVGSLEIKDTDPTVRKAVERIISNSGILK